MQIGKLTLSKAELVLVVFFCLFVASVGLNIGLLWKHTADSGTIDDLNRDKLLQRSISDSALFRSWIYESKADSLLKITLKRDSENILTLNKYAPSKISTASTTLRSHIADSIRSVHLGLNRPGTASKSVSGH